MSNLDEIRKTIFAGKHFKTRIVPFFDTEIELRQPTVGQLLNNKLDEKENLAVAQILIMYAYVPGTDQKVFEQADYDSIKELPAGTWIGDIFQTFAELTGAKGAEAEKNSVTTP